MTRRIFRAIFIMASAVLISCLFVTVSVLYRYFGDIQKDQLEIHAILAAQGVNNEGSSYFDGLKTSGYRVTWIAPDGDVLYDSKVGAEEMENHGTREEVIEALQGGKGESERYSSTLLEKTMYYAKRIDDGSVIRVSVVQNSLFVLMLGILQPISIVIVLALILAFVLSSRLSKRIVEPLNSLNLDKPLENDTYEELSPLLTRIEQQHRQIQSQMYTLKRNQDEFSAVTNNMKEGLVLLGENGTILSINPSAARLFGADAGCIGKNILTINRSTSMQKLIKAAWDGESLEMTAIFAGREYQINATPVASDGKTIGVCLFAFDITDKAQAERIRQEFSANVSHELKTPLHSIMGSAELIENGLVKPEDMPQFIKRIRLESSRLVTLIDDIIRLSELDEGGDLPKEGVNIKNLIDEALETLAPTAAAKDIALSSDCENAIIYGVRRLIYEIIYNLCDNAIKYNVPNGSVKVTLKDEAQDVRLIVSDTGIGIPKEHQSRIFERFYRVDKSHSRSTGGTGLGLSIVKHAAEYHKAEILLESDLGEGTSITVKFPKKIV